jgi:glycosyltransferase involved in cell wall biosynthesis
MGVHSTGPLEPINPMKVAILHQGFIPHYRIGFYELLNKISRTEYVVFHGAPPSGSGSIAAIGPLNFPNRRIENREFQLANWKAFYQPVVREVLNGNYDAVVLGHEIKFLSNFALALLCKILRIPVLYWGFGYHYTADTSQWFTRPAIHIKAALAALSDGYLTYTKQGAQRLEASGYPRERIFILQNTIDMSAQFQGYAAAQDFTLADLRQELCFQPNSIVLIYIGRLLESKDVALLIEAVEQMNRNAASSVPVEAAIIGSGPLLNTLQRQAAANPAIKFVGQINDPATIGRYMRIAAAVVIPGTVGLAIAHAFAHGRPLLTRRLERHGPELEYLVPNYNGIIVDGDQEQFIKTLSEFVSNPDWQSRLSEGALQSREGLRLENMVSQFDYAVTRTIEWKRHPSGSPIELQS